MMANIPNHNRQLVVDFVCYMQVILTSMFTFALKLLCWDGGPT